MWSISRLFELIFNVNQLFKRIECEKKLICSMLNIQSSVLLKRQKDNNFMHFYISKHLCLYIMWQNVSKTCQTVYTINFLVWFNPPFLKFSNTLYNIFTWKIFSCHSRSLNVESIEKSSGFIRGWKEIGSRQAFRRRRFCVDVGTRARNPPVAELYPILAIKFVIRSAL